MSGEEAPRAKWVGAFEYYLDDTPEVVPLSLYELTSSSKSSQVDYRSLQSICGKVPRTLELWASNKSTRIILGTESEAPLRFYSQAYEGLEYRALDEDDRVPKFISEYDYFVSFDAELDHAVPYTFWDEDYGILSRLLTAISGPIWIQFAFIEYNWSPFAERGGQGLQTFYELAQRSPQAQLAGTTIGEHGRKIGMEFTEKAHKPGRFLHIRGMLPSPEDLDPSSYSGKGVQSVFENLSIHFDNVTLFGYGGNQVSKVGKWLRSRNIPDPTKFLEMNAQVFENLPESGMARWGHGRELVPGFPLTSEELTYFLALPGKPKRIGERSGRGKSAGKANYCSACGTRLESGDRFCPECGAEIR